MKPNKTDIDVTQLRGRIIETVERVLGKEYEPRNLALSSLKMLELIVALEEEFAIHISEDAPLVRITSSVDALVEYLRSTIHPAKLRSNLAR